MFPTSKSDSESDSDKTEVALKLRRNSNTKSPSEESNKKAPSEESSKKAPMSHVKVSDEPDAKRARDEESQPENSQSGAPQAEKDEDYGWPGYSKVCVGGDIEFIHVATGTEVWCGYDKSMWMIRAGGHPKRDWRRHETSSDEI